MFKKGNQINNNKIPWNKGISYTPEVCKKMSEIRKIKGTSVAQLKVLNKMSENNKGRIHMKEQVEAQRMRMLGKKLSEETKKKISISNMGKISSRKGAILTEETKQKISMAQKGRISPYKGIKRPEVSGIYHWNWKGGINPINDTLRKTLEYKIWRESVFKRDNYICVIGGKEHGNNLHADHIKSFAYFPELRFAIDNGRTLCLECHRKTDTYAGRSNKKLLVLT